MEELRLLGRSFLARCPHAGPPSTWDGPDQKNTSWACSILCGVDGCELHFAPPKKPWFLMIPLSIAMTNNGFNHGFSGANGFGTHPQFEQTPIGGLHGRCGPFSIHSKAWSCVKVPGPNSQHDLLPQTSGESFLEASFEAPVNSCCAQTIQVIPSSAQGWWLPLA